MALSLQHLALGIPDLKVGADFYSTFGLEANEADKSGDMLAFRSDGRGHDEVILMETGQDRKLHHVSFGSNAAGLEQIAKRLDERGVVRIDPPAPGLPGGLWFRDPDNNLVNVHQFTAVEQEAEPVGERNSPGVRTRLGKRGTPPRDQVRARPRRLGHMIMFTTDVHRQAKFFTEVLGMQVSDIIEGEYGVFMRTDEDSDHHVLGLLKSTAPGFHHASFEMASIDETALGAMRIKEAGYKHAWGPGRHGVGSNYFHYFRDPWNGMAEYFFDIDYIPKDFEWEAQDWTKKDGMFLWSADGPPPPDFGKNYEAD